jgi:hypothetical protein
MRPYRVMICAVPAEPSVKCSVLVLDDDQQELLEQFADQILTQDQWRELNEAVLDNVTQALYRELEQELSKET